MPANFPPHTRGVWPFEQSPLLDRVTEPGEKRIGGPEDIKSIFSGMITELFDGISPRDLYDEPYSQHTLAFRITPDLHSEILIIVTKQGCGTDLSDQIIVQDRLFGKIRDEHIYQSTDGRDGVIVKIHCGDIAVLNHSLVVGHAGKPDNGLLEGYSIGHEQPVGKEELGAIMDLSVMGEVVDLSAIQADQLNYPHPDRLSRE